MHRFRSVSLWIALLALLLVGKSLTAQGTPGSGFMINSFETPADLARVQPILSQIAQVPNYVTSYTYALKVSTPISQWYPGITIVPASGVWDFSQCGGLAFDMANPDPITLNFGIRLEDSNGNASSFDTSLEAGGRAAFRLPFSTTLPDPAIYGLRALPNPYVSMRVLPIVLYAPFDLTHITKINFYLRQPAQTHTFYLDSVRLLASYSVGSLLTGGLDAYGQYSKASWSGKFSASSTFASRAQAETLDLALHPPATNLDVWGGWLGAPAQTATGFFTTAKVNGRWWLVTPDGHLFFSVGMNAVTLGDDYNATLITARQTMFSWLPATTDPLADHFGFTNKIFAGLVPQGTTYNFAAANAERKYGSTWDTAWLNNALQRLPSWGFNTLGLWSDSRLAASQKMPYVVTSGTGGTTTHVDSGNNVWGPMPDPFDPTFPALVSTNLTNVTAQAKNDPWCLGYFVDNELSWTGKGNYPNYGLAYGALALNASSSPAKAAFVAQLQAKYTSIDALNTAWGTTFASWAAFSLPFKASPTPNVALQGDLSAFVSLFAQKYFSIVRAQLKALDPNHLYLGCRFLPYTPEVLQAAAGQCDALSFNIYQPTVDPTQWSILTGFNKPCLVSEFHIGAWDRGLFGTGPVAAPNQSTRAKMYQSYVQSVVDNPNFVGCHWYEFMDEPTLGRTWDGENFNIGFVDVTDTPYPEMVAAARAVNFQVYTRRYTGQ